MYLPNYEKSILSIVASILDHYGIECPSKVPAIKELSIPNDTKTIVLMIFDGMGSNIISRLDNDSFLQKNTLTNISSVFPCTTTAATKSFYSGRAPISHGYLGWNCYFKECGRNIAILKNRDFFSGEPIEYAADLLKFTSIFDLIEKHCGKEVSVHHLMPSFAQNGYSTLEAVEKEIVSICNDDCRHFVLLYWDLPDSIMHIYGPYSNETMDYLKYIDSFAERISNSCKKSSIIITADHGMKPIEKCILLNDNTAFMDCLYLPPSLEYRSMSLFVKPHKKELFEDIFLSTYGEEYVLLQRNTVFEKHLFGYGTPHKKIDDFVGDYLACATGNLLLQYISPFSDDITIFKGHHSGLTKEEIMIPLIYFEN